MANRYTKGQQIIDLLKALNEKRQRENKVGFRRCWTGYSHWLRTDEKNYKQVCELFTNADEFIGFLKGLLFDLNQFDEWRLEKNSEQFENEITHV